MHPRLVADRYRLLAPLGSGGMGTVWRARDEVLGREVAVKEVTFPPGLADADRDVLRERTRREARAAAALHSPSAVTVFDVVEEGGAPYLVMELVEARTLAEVVRDDGPRPPQEVARIGLSLLDALETAHRAGIVHRDVKPSNVLVRPDGRVVLTDFGIATTTGDPSLTHTGLLLGSPAYMSPERAVGGVPGPPADLWSLGATLYTAVEGRPPYDQSEALATVLAVVNGQHSPYAAAGPLVPVLDGLLVKDPDARLDAPGARRLLEAVAAGPAQRNQVLPAPVLDRSPTTVVDPEEVRDLAAAPPGGAPPVPVPPVPVVPVPAEERSTAVAPVPTAREEVRGPAPVPPRPAPARPSRGRRAGLVAGLLAVPLVAGAVALAVTTGDDPDGGTAAQAPASSAPPTSAPTAPPATTAPPVAPSSPAAPSPTTTPPPSSPPPSPAAPAPTTPPAPAGGLPAGWTTDTGGAGWTVALPPGYAQTRPGEYRNAATGRTLRVETGEGQPDAVADRERAAVGFAQRNPSYEEISIEPVDYREYEAADWEFTYSGLRVLNRVFVVDGTGHSLFFQFPQGQEGADAEFERIADEFVPVGG